jgi:photosynthetic reaction center cytochrome c subunit
MSILHTIRLPLVALAATATLAGCNPPPHDVVQRGYRGTGMELVVDKAERAESVAANKAPDVIPQVPPGGPKAGDLYENVEVLGDLTVGEFTRVMASITQWVAPEEGCNYCHVPGNFASEDVYTKKVARSMLAMTQRINEDWGEKHVAPAGVTCYTCHRGQAVPQYAWSHDPGPETSAKIDTNGQNIASPTAAYSSLPYDPLTPFLEEDYPISLQGNTALPTGPNVGTKQAEWTYSLMMHFSDSLNANCTFCHNSRAFANWEQSPYQRVKAWHAIRMVRETNNGYIKPTGEWLPPHRLGPMGDVPKVSCMTCHQGAYKPMYGANMIDPYPSLARKTGVAVDMAEEAAAAKAERDGPVPAVGNMGGGE